MNISNNELFLSWPQLVQNSMEWRASSIWVVFMHLLRHNLSPRNSQGFSASLIYVERHGQGVPVSWGILRISYPKVCLLPWSLVLTLVFAYIGEPSCPFIILSISDICIRPRLFMIVTHKAGVGMRQNWNQAELSLVLSDSQLLLAVWIWTCS